MKEDMNVLLCNKKENICNKKINMNVLLCNEENSGHDSLEDVDILKCDTVNQEWKQFQINENKISPVSTITKLNEEHTCIFCLESGELIQFCSCNVMAHKTCAIEYITYPGSLNDKCCMCRQKLEYLAQDENTPMKMKYAIILSVIIISVLLVSAASLYMHVLLIPVRNWNMFVYVCALSNLSMFYPLLMVVAIGFVIDYYSPRGRISDSICYCGHEDIPVLNLRSWTGDRGVGYAVIILLCLLFVMTCIVLVGISYITYGFFKFYRSFKLKSKKDICFQHERPVNVV